MNIYLRELKAHRKSLIIWCVAMIFLIVAGMGKYSAAISTGDNSFNELMKQMPQSLQGLFGVGIYDLTIALDYFAILFLYIALMGTIHAIMIGTGIIAKEERDKTVEFLLIKPISRQQIITAKLLAAYTNVLILNVVTYISCFIAFSYYSKDDPFSKGLFQLMVSLLALQLFFTALGGFLAAYIKKPKASSAIGTSILLFMFMLSIIIDIVSKFEFLSYFTFFQYYDPKDFLKGDYPIIYPIITGILFFALTYGTYFFYKKRDLQI